MNVHEKKYCFNPLVCKAFRDKCKINVSKVPPKMAKTANNMWQLKNTLNHCCQVIFTCLAYHGPNIDTSIGFQDWLVSKLFEKLQRAWILWCHSAQMKLYPGPYVCWDCAFLCWNINRWDFYLGNLFRDWHSL